MAFDYTSLFRTDLPGPARHWTGFPEYNFIGGHNDAEIVPVDDLISASQRVLARDGHLLATYDLASGPQGYLPLREFLAASLETRTAMRQTADDILIVSGSVQALDLVNAVLLSVGDTVIVEEATYIGALMRLKRLGVHYVGIPMDREGIRMDALSAALERLKAAGTRPKYIYTVPTVQNPTGTVMPESRRRELLQIAREHDVPVFEDDCYADLTFDGDRPKAIRALDDDGRVIYCGSFSKSVAPALRIGYAVAEWDVLSRMMTVKRDLGTAALEQMVLAEFCVAHFETHVSKLRHALKLKCETMMESIAAEFGTAAEFTPPKGGQVLWITLPDTVDTARLAEAAIAEGVAFNAGIPWSADAETGRNRFRLCYAHPSQQAIRDGIARLAEICHRETGLPAQSGNIGRPSL